MARRCWPNPARAGSCRANTPRSSGIDSPPPRRPDAAAGRAALAQEAFPARSLRLIIPFPPGGPTDVYARLYAGRVGRELGQSIVTEDAGIEPADPGTPESAAALLSDEIARYRPVVESGRAELGA